MAPADLGWILLKCPGCRSEWSVQYLRATREVPKCPNCGTAGYPIGTSSQPPKKTKP